MYSKVATQSAFFKNVASEGEKDWVTLMAFNARNIVYEPALRFLCKEHGLRN